MMEDLWKKISTNPEFVELLRKVRTGELRAKEAAAHIVNEEASEDLVKAVKEYAEQTNTALVRVSPESSGYLDQWGLTEEDLVFQPNPEIPTLMLHPLYQALLLEVIQFDGDVPELRTGVLPAAASPAVPVKTESRNPVQVGAMLKSASKEVKEELKASEDKIVAALGSVASSTALSPQDRSSVVRTLLQQPAETEGYKAGQKAVARTVDPPGVHEMASMSMVKKQELFHHALTSTQGRRSAAPVVASLILRDLSVDGVKLLQEKPKEDPRIREQWTVGIDGWSGEMNPRFSYIDTAARSLARKIRSEINSNSLLYVKPVNTVSESVVGFEVLVF